MTLPGIWLNEDNSHFFFTRTAIHAGYNVIEMHAGEAMTVGWIKIAVAPLSSTAT